MFKYLKAFQCDNGHEFKNEVTKSLEKQNVDIRRARTKYRVGKTRIEVYKKQVIVSCIICKIDMIELLCVKN